MALDVENIVSLSCLKVGIGPHGGIPMVVRVSIVDYHGRILFDSLVAPICEITNYNSRVTGIVEGDLVEGNTLPFDMVQACVAYLVRRKMVVGPRTVTDFTVLGIDHPLAMVRDMTAYHKLFPTPSMNPITWGPATNKMCKRCLHGQQHNIELARVAMDVYRKAQPHWDEVAERTLTGQGTIKKYNQSNKVLS